VSLCTKRGQLPEEGQKPGRFFLIIQVGGGELELCFHAFDEHVRFTPDTTVGLREAELDSLDAGRHLVCFCFRRVREFTLFLSPFFLIRTRGLC
jgi:hypothetical protein